MSQSLAAIARVDREQLELEFVRASGETRCTTSRVARKEKLIR